MVGAGVEDSQQQQAETPPVFIAPRGGGGGGGGWTGERVGWTQDGVELLSPEESAQVRKELGKGEEQVIFSLTRVVFEEETYVFEDGTSQRALPSGAVELDEEYGSGYVVAEDANVEPVLQSPPDWIGLLVGALASFVVGRVAARVHPALTIIVGVGGAWLVRDRPWALGGVMLGAPLALVKAEPVKMVAKRKKAKLHQPSTRKRIKMRVQRMRVYGRLKTRR